MLRKVLRFELIYRFSSPITYLMLAMLIFQAGWFSIGAREFYVNKAAFINAGGISYLCLSAGGMLLIIVIALITASTLYRDIEQRSAGFIYAYHINEKSFFIAHFVSAWVINLIMMLGYVFGLVLLKYIWPLPNEDLGPIAWGSMFHAFLFFAVPNMLTYTALAFFSLVMTRRMMAVYVSITAVVLIFVIGEHLSENSQQITLLSLIDPFGFIYVKQQLNLMSLADINAGLIPLNDVFWLNRLLWISISLGLFAVAFSRFSFKRFIETPREKQRSAKNIEQHTSTNIELLSATPQRQHRQDGWYPIRKFLRLTWLEFITVTRPMSFKLIMAIMTILILAQNLVWSSTYYVGHQYPLTSGMTSARLINGFMMIIVLMILSCELFFKDRKTQFWQLSGASPAKAWEQQLPKLFAMFAVAFLFASTLFIAGIFSQLIQGFTQIDWLLYLQDIYGYMWGWLNYILFICFVFVLANVTGHRFLTHCLAIGYYLFVIISFDFGLIENIRYIYGAVPGFDSFSEMNRYGIFALSGFWFFLLWLSLACFFVFMGLHFWRRGVAQSFVSRFLGRGGEISRAAKFIALVPLVCFILVHIVIEHEVYQKRNYVPSAQLEQEAAAYETTYRERLNGYDFNQAITALSVDLFPSERLAVTTASVELTYAGKESVDRLYFNVDAFSTITELTISDHTVKLLDWDKRLGMATYSVEPAVKPNTTVSVGLIFRRQYSGFSQSEAVPQADLAFNGLFNTALLPVLGFDENKTIQSDRARQNWHLPAINDLETNEFDSHFQTDYAFVGENIDLAVTTDAGQIPMAPGVLIQRSVEHGRQQAVFRINNSGSRQIFVGSARYSERKREIEGVDVTYLYHPEHTFNLDAFDGSLAQSLQFIRENLGDYPYDTLRLVEIPFYQDKAYVSANIIALSEKEGWFADFSVAEVQSFIQFTLAKALIRQWLEQQGQLADTTGADMLRHALPSALALQMVEQHSEPTSLNALINKIRTQYYAERYSGLNEETPLVQTDDELIAETKGALALYQISKSIGFNEMNRFLAEWLASHQNDSLVFADFYSELKKTYSLDESLLRLFETVELNPEI